MDPLLPSDGHRGFWSGEYSYGRVYGGGPHSSDMVVAPLVAVLLPDSDRGPDGNLISLALLTLTLLTLALLSYFSLCHLPNK